MTNKKHSLLTKIEKQIFDKYIIHDKGSLIKSGKFFICNGFKIIQVFDSFLDNNVILSCEVIVENIIAPFYSKNRERFENLFEKYSIQIFNCIPDRDILAILIKVEAKFKKIKETTDVFILIYNMQHNEIEHVYFYPNSNSGVEYIDALFINYQLFFFDGLRIQSALMKSNGKMITVFDMTKEDKYKSKAFSKAYLINFEIASKYAVINLTTKTEEHHLFSTFSLVINIDSRKILFKKWLPQGTDGIKMWKKFDDNILVGFLIPIKINSFINYYLCDLIGMHNRLNNDTNIPQ